MNHLDRWNRFLAEPSETTLADLEEACKSAPSQDAQLCLGRAHLAMGQKEPARTCFEKLLDSGSTEAAWIWLGVIEWIEGKRADARESWENALDAKGAQDGALPFLWYAAARLSDDDLKKRVEKISQGAWLDNRKLEDPALELRRQCRADFWFGVKASHLEKAKRLFQKATAHREGMEDPEYFLAQSELGLLNKDP
jgi:tetratricopeptide (TPR) repeat protein